MANIDPTPSWADIRRLETSDRNMAGPGGILNDPTTSIAARLNLLRDNDTTLGSSIAAVNARQDAADTAIANIQGQVLNAPGTLSDLENGSALDPAAGFPDVPSVENALGPVTAINESIESLTARTKQLRDDQTAATEVLAAPTGAQLIGYGDGTVASRLERLPVFPESFGAKGDGVTDDTAALQAALEVCVETGRTLVLTSPAYVMNAPILYHQRRHSIAAWSHSVIDFRGCADGTWCVQVANPSADGSHIWDTLINEVRNIEFLGRPGLNGWKNDGATTDTSIGSPRSMFVACYFTDFTNTLYFGNSEWCAVFDRCSFRGGGGTFITTSRTFNAGENLQFAKCIFNGANASLLWNHINGPFELTFDGCSFDYCLGIMRYDTSYTTGRLIARYRACHFEDNGSTTQFSFTLPPTQTFNIELSGCDWYYTGTVPQYLAEIVSAHRSSHLIVRDCVIPIFTTQDRKLAELFKWNDTAGRFVAQGNSLQTDVNALHTIFSRKVSRYPKLNAANFKPTYGPFVFSDAASPQIVERITTGQPPGAQGDIYRSTGGSSFTVLMPHDEGRAWNICGWLYRTTAAYQVQVRFFRSDGTLIANPTIVSVPGTLNDWVRFGISQLRAPIGTVRASVSTVPAGGQTASDFNMLCDVVAEQID